MRPRRALAALLVLAAVVATQAACSAGDGAGGSAAAAPQRFRVLVFSKTTGYRHRSIPVAVAAIRRLGREHGFGVDHTEDERRFTDRSLARYDALIFLSSPEKKTVPVGVVSELIRGDIYFWGQLMAGALLGSIPVAIVYSFFVEYYVTGLTGSVKG